MYNYRVTIGMVVWAAPVSFNYQRHQGVVKSNMTNKADNNKHDKWLVYFPSKAEFLYLTSDQLYEHKEDVRIMTPKSIPRSSFIQ
jgi:hypothetical protein